MLSLEWFASFFLNIFLKAFVFPFFIKKAIDFHCRNFFPFKHLLKKLLITYLIINTSFLNLKEFVEFLIIIDLHFLAPVEILKPFKKWLNSILFQIFPSLVGEIYLFLKIINFNYKNFSDIGLTNCFLRMVWVH